MDALNKRCEGTMNTALGIRYTAFGEDYLKCEMPVDTNTIQPLGMLNGGASLALIEILGSMAANLAVDRQRFVALGQAVHAHHFRPAMKGETVTGKATALHIGKSSHVWEVVIKNQSAKVVCKGSITMAIVPIEKISG